MVATKKSNKFFILSIFFLETCFGNPAGCVNISTRVLQILKVHKCTDQDGHRV